MGCNCTGDPSELANDVIEVANDVIAPEEEEEEEEGMGRDVVEAVGEDGEDLGG